MGSRAKRRHPLADTKRDETGGASPRAKPRFALSEQICWTGLAGLVIYFLAVSWRKWPDPLIDFGRELYLPWRLANGALLYRDADDYFGPLSQYLNAGLF